ncbi:MAG: S24 family peptidase [bacterium]
MQYTNSITSKERKLLETYAWAKKTYNRKPSLSELSRLLGYRSVNSVKQFIAALHKKGVQLDTYKGASGVSEVLRSLVEIPVLGIAPCGIPFFAQENWEGQIPVDTSVLNGKPSDFFFLKAQGNSMNLAGIDDGDFVLFRSQPSANPGDRVVALIGDQATIKIFKPCSGYVALLPKSSDPAMKPIIVAEDLQIQGVVKLVVKKDIAE